MDLEKRNQIPELYDYYHRADNELYTGYNYKENVLIRSLSKQIFKNDNTNGFLLKLQEMTSLMIDSNVIIRNWFVHTVSKYFDRHPN
jgi:hypothetical protein